MSKGLSDRYARFSTARTRQCKLVVSSIKLVMARRAVRYRRKIAESPYTIHRASRLPITYIQQPAESLTVRQWESVWLQGTSVLL